MLLSWIKYFNKTTIKNYLWNKDSFSFKSISPPHLQIKCVPILSNKAKKAWNTEIQWILAGHGYKSVQEVSLKRMSPASLSTARCRTPASWARARVYLHWSTNLPNKLILKRFESLPDKPLHYYGYSGLFVGITSHQLKIQIENATCPQVYFFKVIRVIK